jgi:hypothetical protein
MPVGGNGQLDLAAVAVRLKAAGGGVLRAELIRSLKSAAAPLIEDARSSAIASLPKAGGLAARVADSRITAAVRLSGNASVRITASQHDAGATNAGYVRHPVFGRAPWVRQDLPGAAMWWDNAMIAGAPKVTKDLLEAIEATSRLIQGV